MASPSALTLPAAAPARHFPISRRGRRVPRRQHPTGPLGGRDVRPCAGARSAARSGRASIVARDGPGLTISTVMDVLFCLVVGDTLCGVPVHLSTCERSFVDVCACRALLFLWCWRAFGSKWRACCLCLPAVSLRCAHSVKRSVKCLVSIWFAARGPFCPCWPRSSALLVSSN